MRSIAEIKSDLANGYVRRTKSGGTYIDDATAFKDLRTVIELYETEIKRRAEGKQSVAK